MSFACPCCGFLTLHEGPPGTFQVCPVCFWEDDFVQFTDHSCRGGANRMSLDEARKNFSIMGACGEEFIAKIRSPSPGEHPGAS